MSTAAGEQKASRYYAAEEEALMKKVCAKFAHATATLFCAENAAEPRNCDMTESHANNLRPARPRTPPSTASLSSPAQS